MYKWPSEVHCILASRLLTGIGTKPGQLESSWKLLMPKNPEQEPRHVFCPDSHLRGSCHGWNCPWRVQSNSVRLLIPKWEYVSKEGESSVRYVSFQIIRIPTMKTFLCYVNPTASKNCLISTLIMNWQREGWNCCSSERLLEQQITHWTQTLSETKDWKRNFVLLSLHLNC